MFICRCDCFLKWSLTRIIRKYNRQSLNFGPMYCTTPNDLNGVTIEDLTFQDLSNYDQISKVHSDKIADRKENATSMVTTLLSVLTAAENSTSLTSNLRPSDHRPKIAGLQSSLLKKKKPLNKIIFELHITQPPISLIKNNSTVSAPKQSQSIRKLLPAVFITTTNISFTAKVTRNDDMQPNNAK